LVTDTRNSFTTWQNELKSYSHAAAGKYYPGKTVIDQAINRIGKQLAIQDSYEFIETLLAGKNDWLDLNDDIHDVISFYKTQITLWQRLLEDMTAFADNHEALLQDINAANAIKELIAIRDNPEPYSHINRIEPLLNTVETINGYLAATEREIALLAIEQKLAEIETALDHVQANADLRNKALHPMQQLKISIAGLNSIPQIRYLAERAGTHLDTAMDSIAAVQKQPTPGIKESGDGNKGTMPQKPVKVIRAQELSNKTYLETEDEVDAYLTQLRKALVAVLQEGKKARIQ